MSFEIVEKSQVVREITLTIPGEDVRKIESKMVEQARKTMSMPGFRKGKVPASLIRKRAGASIDEDARREAVQNAVREAIANVENLIHVGQVDILTPKSEDGGLVARVNVEVPPTLKVGNYKGLEISVADANVTDEQVEQELQNRRERNAVIEPVEDRKVVEAGDITMVTINSVNEAAEKICRTGDRQISLGKGYFNEEMEKQIVGATIGNAIELKANIKDGEEEKEAVVSLVVNEIKKRVLPELDDEFARDNDAENLDALREAVKKELMENAEKARDEEIENKLMEKLRADNGIEIPEGYVRARAAQAIRLQLEQMMRQQIGEEMLDRIANNMRPEELQEYKDDYHNEIILNEIAKAENIEISDDDTLKEAMKWFQNMDENRVKAWLKTNNASQFVGDQVKRDRAYDIVKDAAKISKAE